MKIFDLTFDKAFEEVRHFDTERDEYRALKIIQKLKDELESIKE